MKISKPAMPRVSQKNLPNAMVSDRRFQESCISQMTMTMSVYAQHNSYQSSDNTHGLYPGSYSLFIYVALIRQESQDGVFARIKPKTFLEGTRSMLEFGVSILPV